MVQMWELLPFFHKELNGTTFSTSWFFELLPKVFHLLYLGPNRPTPTIKISNNISNKADIKPVRGGGGLFGILASFG